MAARSDAALAATAYQKVIALFNQEQAELKRSPQEITQRYAERRERVLAALSPESRVLACGMLNANMNKSPSTVAHASEVEDA